MCTWELPVVEVARLVNYFSAYKLVKGKWRIGKEPYSRANPPPLVSF